MSRVEEGLSLEDRGKRLMSDLEESDCLWVLSSVMAGAGHKRQLYCAEVALRNAGKDPVVVYLDLQKSDSPWVKRLSNWYNSLQNHPAVFKTLKPILEMPVWDKTLEYEMRRYGQMEVLENAIVESPNYTNKRKVVIVSTHSMCAEMTATLAQQSRWRGRIVDGEFVPDPWEGFDLKAMTAVDSVPGKHLMIVHDQDTVIKARAIRTGRKILGWGTLSPVESLFELPVEKDFSRIPPHIGIEFSGNELPKYDEKVLQFLRTIEDDLRTGKMRLTIHTMQHKGTQFKIKEWADKAGLSACEFLHVINSEDVREAIVSRYEYMVGRDRFGKPDAVITKGGEVPLEDRVRTMIIAVYNGSTHEDRDINVACQEKPGFVKDFRRVPVMEWWSRIKQGLNELPEGVPDVRSTAILALGMLAKL